MGVAWCADDRRPVMSMHWDEFRVFDKVVVAEAAVKVHVNLNSAISHEVVSGAPLEGEMTDMLRTVEEMSALW